METCDLIINTGYKNGNFIVFNPLGIGCSEDALQCFDIQLDDNEFWKDLRSKAWSSGCRIFFVMREESIIVANVYDNNALVCNLTVRVFEEFMNFFVK